MFNPLASAISVLVLLSSSAESGLSFGGGDLVVENISTPTKAPTVDISSVVAKAKQIDPVHGAEIEQALAAPATLAIAEFRSDGNYGIHDHNIIALNPDYGLVVMAISLLHDWRHVQACNGGPVNGGVANWPQPSSCSACDHVPLVADSWTLFVGQLCEPPCLSMSPELRKKTCDVVVDYKKVAESTYARCQASTCAVKPDWESLANWSVACPCCP